MAFLVRRRTEKNARGSGLWVWYWIPFVRAGDDDPDFRSKNPTFFFGWNRARNAARHHLFFFEQILSTLVFFYVDAKNEIRLPAHLHNMWPLLIAISLSFVQRGLPMTQFGWVQMQFRSLNVIFKPAKMEKERLRLWICNHFTPKLQKFNLHSFFGRNRKKNELNFYSIIVSFILYFFCLAFNATGEIPGNSIFRQELCHWSGGAGVSYWSHFVLTIRQRMHLAEKIDTIKKLGDS